MPSVCYRSLPDLLLEDFGTVKGDGAVKVGFRSGLGLPGSMNLAGGEEAGEDEVAIVRLLRCRSDLKEIMERLPNLE
ncbi:hypothetical protein ACLOJK_014811 [Asimina triloba]